MTVTLTLSDSAILTDPTGAYATTPEAALSVLEPLRDRAQEHFLAITVDVRMKILAVHTITIGTATASLVHARELFRPAILDNAASVILAHNHPSGDCSPSYADLETTAKLRKAGEIMGIQVIDHIIVSKTDHRSLRATNPELFQD